MVFYKIRNHEGLFSDGEYCPEFVIEGKVWNNKTDVLLHLSDVAKGCHECICDDVCSKRVYFGAMVIEYEAKEVGAQFVRILGGQDQFVIHKGG